MTVFIRTATYQTANLLQSSYDSRLLVIAIRFILRGRVSVTPPCFKKKIVKWHDFSSLPWIHFGKLTSRPEFNIWGLFLKHITRKRCHPGNYMYCCCTSIIQDFSFLAFVSGPSSLALGSVGSSFTKTFARFILFNCVMSSCLFFGLLKKGTFPK